MHDINQLLKKLKVRIKNRDLIRQAFIHPSFAQENPGCDNNQRLEFLGDAVLDFVIGDYLFKHFKEYSEGDLSKTRAWLVCEQSLFDVANKLELGRYLYLGKGEELSGGRKKKSILADTFEALVGAVYLDAGIKQVRFFIINLLKKYLADVPADNLQDYKSSLQELVQSLGKENVYYAVIAETGPAHARYFSSGVFYKDTLLAQGKGESKKISEQKAAEEVLKDPQILERLSRLAKEII